MSPYTTCIGCNRLLYWPDELQDQQPLCVECELRRAQAEADEQDAPPMPPGASETIESRGDFDEGAM